MLTPAWTKYRPHEIQRALWTSKKRFVAVAAGRGSGKTDLLKRRLVRYLPVRKPWQDPRYFYGAPTEGQARRVAWDDLLALIPKEWNPTTRGNCITTKFGSELWVVGLDKPMRIEGSQWDGCGLDESCDLKPGTFNLNVLPALTHRDGWCWRIGVPKRQGPSATEFRKFFEQAQSGEVHDAVAFTWPSADILSSEALAYARTHMDPKDFREQFEAVFETAGGGIFYAFDREYNMRPCAYDPKLPIIVGSDFNVDPMAWVLGHQYENRIEWFDEIWKRNTNTAESLTVLYERYNTHRGGFEFYGDATSDARKTSASESDYQQIYNDLRFKQLGRTIHYPKGNPPVADRFAACNAMFLTAEGRRRMFIDSRCKYLIVDLEARYYKVGTTEPADKGDLGHMTDAMGYPVYRMFPIKYIVDTPKQIVTVLQG